MVPPTRGCAAHRCSSRPSPSGRLSDADGSFQIGGIPAGTHVVEIGLIGYATERQEVSIADGQVTQLDVTISEEAIALAGIVAIGTAGPATHRDRISRPRRRHHERRKSSTRATPT